MIPTGFMAGGWRAAFRSLGRQSTGPSSAAEYRDGSAKTKRPAKRKAGRQQEKRKGGREAQGSGGQARQQEKRARQVLSQKCSQKPGLR